MKVSLIVEDGAARIVKTIKAGGKAAGKASGKAVKETGKAAKKTTRKASSKAKKHAASMPRNKNGRFQKKNKR